MASATAERRGESIRRGAGLRKLPLVAGQTPEDLERVSAALTSAGVGFEVEQNISPGGGTGSWAWRVLVVPQDLPRAREVIEPLLRSRASPELESRGVPAPGPLYEPGRGDWLRWVVVVACLAGALWLLLRRG